MKYCKYFCLLICLMPLVLGCGTQRIGIYSVQMQDVMRVPAEEKQDLVFTTTQLSDGTTQYSFEDLTLKIIWKLSPIQFDFTLSNKTDSTFSIIWDQARYITAEGDSLPIIHKDIALENRFDAQPESGLPARFSMEDYFLPRDHIAEEPLNFSLWKIDHLFANKRDAIGSKITLVLPLRLHSGTYFYSFHFLIDNWTNPPGIGLFDWLK